VAQLWRERSDATANRGLTWPVVRCALVELEGIEPSSAEGSPPAIRPFPISPLAAMAVTGHLRSECGKPLTLGATGGSFPAASVLSRRQPSLRLSPFASVTGLR